MAGDIFRVAEGIRIPHVGEVHPAYEVEKNEDGWRFTVVLDAPRIPHLLWDYCQILPEPGYFTLELPEEASWSLSGNNADARFCRRLQSVTAIC